MRSFGPVLLALFVVGIGPALCVDNPCQTASCPSSTYCQKLPPTEEEPYKCIENGYLLGNCSLNTVETCAPATTCTEKPDRKSYTCKCDDEMAIGNGIRLDKGGSGCLLSVKECKSNAECPQYGFCSHEGHCKCKDGFSGNGFNCTDIIDCPSTNCDKHAICEDIPGSYTCTCDASKNFRGNGTFCEHVCASDNDCDPPRGRCNLQAECECRAGYSGNGTHCKDIDECAVSNLNDCPEGAYCINSPGGFDCKCRNGYFGDGKNCKLLPTNCDKIDGMQNGHVYIIDPDGTGPAVHFEVECNTEFGQIVTKVNPVTPMTVHLKQTDYDAPIDYGTDPENLKPLLEKSGFCYQDIGFACYRHFRLFPDTKWYDAYGVEHNNWGSTQDDSCACGELGICGDENKCFCDGVVANKWVVNDNGQILDKRTLPVVRVVLRHRRRILKGKLRIGPLICMKQQAGVPKNCHDAKFNFKIKNDGPLYIDVDGAGPLKPFLVKCDMTSFDNVGITEIPPNAPIFNIKTIEGEPVEYRVPSDKLRALISGSVFCSQSVEFECKNSVLLGNGGGSVSVGSSKRRLDYFPGANGVQNTCGCGATKSCESPEVTCNCNINDGKVRKDFGLIINKEDLPVVHLTGQYGDQKTSVYSVGPMKCAGSQFGIEPNCEKYRATGTDENYTYFIDPDGPGKLDPFLVECEFTENPPQGKTYVHHTKEIAVSVGDTLDLRYLDVSPEQIEALKNRSTYCSQEVKVDCNKLKLQATEDIIEWEPTNQTALLSLLDSLLSCTDGNGCNCNGVDNTNDQGELIEMDSIPAQRFDMSKVKDQLANGATGAVTVGPLVCSEVFTTCAALQRFIKFGNSVEGEAAVVNGRFTIDPDGAGGVEPFEVNCKFPQTIVPLTPTSKPIDPDSDETEQCFDIEYKDSSDSPISPAQMDALAKASGACTQTLTLDCANAPATGKVSFSSCDGKKQQGWGGSRGNEGCACGLTGICDGGSNDKCNCDVGDSTVRSDSGTILDNSRLPVCKICLSNPGGEGNTTDETTPMQKFEISKLVCDATPVLPRTCQDARYLAKFSGEAQNVPVTLSIAKKQVTAGCKFYDSPPVSAMLVTPRETVYPPDGDKPLNVDITYVTIDIVLTRLAMSRNVYCRQKIFFFCVGGQAIETGSNAGYYDQDGNVYDDWEMMPSDSPDVERVCTQQKELCDRCGNPVAYVIKSKSKLPVKTITLTLKGVTVVVDHVECLNMRRSCQELVDVNQRWYGKLGTTYNKHLLDPDGPGELFPFVAKCFFYLNYGVGITEIPLDGKYEGKIKVTDQTIPGQFEIPLELDDVSLDQARALTSISDFCWQNVRYECKKSPLLNNGVDPASYYYLNSSSPSTSFGTDDKLNVKGCACGILGTCVKPDVTCNCDAKGPMSVDQGAVTDKNVLPIAQINVGGQTADSEVNILASPLQCGKYPVTPPRDCQQGLEFKEKNNVVYGATGEYLISPAPRTTKAFMVYCDYELLPGKAVTVVKPDYPPTKPVDDSSKPEDIPYKGPDEDQVKALIAYSKYCYQGVKIECQGSQVFSGGAYWLAGASTTKQKFWGGGDPYYMGGVCACGRHGECGGLDSYTAQRQTKCNCDIGDDFPRKDSGIITQKKYLPVSKFVFGNGKFGNVNITVGDLICSQKPIKFNECELGYHDCHPKAKCIDQDVGYRCECKVGWQGKTQVNDPNAARANGRECIDDKECTWSPCSHTSTCTDTPGSFFCTCKSGYRKVDELTCVDINECKENTHDCHENARCENLQGSYRCACKKGYRGDGKKMCRAIGECKCFGDPHCLSFDSRWLHYQGLCEYVMSKDNCESGDEPTYQVWTKYWRRGSTKPGYYSYVESVRIKLGDLEIKLVQNRGIQVNGILVDQYVNPDGVTAIRYNREVVVKTPIGLEVQWDGKDAVTVIVPDSKKGDTCGMCGNYNGDDKDDWTVGESCEAKEGTVTDNFALFGNSWTLKNGSEMQCDVDCNPEVPPDPRDCDRKEIIEYECGKLLNTETSPFKECLNMMTKEDREQFLMSCSYDLCFVEHDFSGSVCSFAETLNKECTEKYKTSITEWRKDVDSCETVECENNMIYKTCGPVSQESCFSSRVNITVEANPDDCYEGCFCSEGLVMESNTCIPKDDCGCLYNNQYIKKGDVVVNADCKTKVKCEGGDRITSSPVSCGQNEECSIGDDGKVACYCEEGFMVDVISGKCVVDPCYNVTCPHANSECHNGVCRCKMGFVGNCDACANVDECATDSRVCSKLGQKCSDLPGSYKCECEAGYLPDKDGNCDDIDECAIFSDKCGDNSECSNTLGGYSCECCAGYKKAANGNCIRDPTLSKTGKCCSCQGDKCLEPGKVCGSDGITYNDYRSMAVTACRKGDTVKANYPGECQGTCETVKCEIPYQTCKPDAAGKPKCGCPSCEDSSAETVSETVCATNKITYTSICHMKAATCEAELEVQVEVESIGKPCGEGPPVPQPGPWSDWGECSEPCKQGEMKRTRDTFGNARASNEETAPCFSTCENGPCSVSTCKLPAQVCSADINNDTSCTCPVCGEFPEQPVCGRIGVVIQTFDNPCELQKQACEAEQDDFELLEPRACEDKPKKCGKIRNFRRIVDDNGCKADRTLNVGACYGGCSDVPGEECCYPTKKERLNLIMSCPDGSYYRKLDDYMITECNCISNEEAEQLKEGMEMNVTV